jgi:hypothetical protein
MTGCQAGLESSEKSSDMISASLSRMQVNLDDGKGENVERFGRAGQLPSSLCALGARIYFALPGSQDGQRARGAPRAAAYVLLDCLGLLTTTRTSSEAATTAAIQVQ